MKSKYFEIAAVLFPLVTIIVLVIIGITVDTWVYLILPVVCSAVVGLIWYIYKGAEKKLTNAGQKAKEMRS